MALTDAVKDLAYSMGFDAIGIASSESFVDEEEITLGRVRVGLMDGLPWYTAERVHRGCDPSQLLPGVRSLISLAISYYSVQEELDDGRARGRVARYAWGRDYHKVIGKRLKQFIGLLPGLCGHEVSTRAYVDTGPLLDRAVAQRAGVGWYGKNTNILTRAGSWVFLAEILTDLTLELDPPLKKTCGNCTRCIEACPTRAIVAPYVIDNRKCISYFTIESRGPIPREMRPLIGDWVFGCDICQDVCPVNRRAQLTRESDFHTLGGLDRTRPDLLEILDLTEETFRSRYRGTAIMRTGLVGLQRNACVALGNVSDSSATPALGRILIEGVPLVRSHSAWALGRIGGQASQILLEHAAQQEGNPDVLEEIDHALRQVVTIGSVESD